MRIDLNTKVASTVENERSTRRKSQSADAKQQAEVGRDEARLSLDHQRLQTLEAGVNRMPEVRHDKVQALQSALEEGSYDVGSEQIAEAMMTEMFARSAHIR
jgi:flagellar biosynthesis anti-sigma factor FlgM